MRYSNVLRDLLVSVLAGIIANAVFHVLAG